MDDKGSFQITDTLRKKATEIEKQAEAAELKRIEQTIAKAADLALMRNKDFWERCEAKLKLADQVREEFENKLLKREEEIQQILEQERVKKLEAYKKELEEKKRKAEEERKRQEEEERRLREELQRKREEEERLRREEEERRKQQEKEEKIQTLLYNARLYLEQGEYEKALVETVKALVNDPEHSEALALKQKIKAAQTVVSEVEGKSIPAVESTKEIETVSRKETVVPPIIEEPPKKRRKKIYNFYIVLVLIVLAGIILWQISPKLFYKKPTIAVLPFRSQNNTLNEERLGIGLAEDIVNRLYYFQDLKIMGFKSAIYLEQNQLKSRNMTLQAGFDYIIDGNITLKDKKIILNLTILDSLDKKIWEGEIVKYEDKIFEIPVDVCNELAERLSLKTQSEHAFRISTFNNSAYQMYLNGLEKLHRLNPANLDSAQELFDTAASQDASFVEAFAMSSYVSMLRYEKSYQTSPEIMQRAAENLQKATSRLPGLLLVQRSQMLYNIFNRKFSEAFDNFERMENISPFYSEAFVNQGLIHTFTGNYEKSIQTFKHAFKYDPYNLDLLRLLSSAYQLNQNYKDAFFLYERYLQFMPDTTQFMISDLSNIILNNPELLVNYSNKIIGLLESRISIRPLNYEDRYKLARIYQAIGKYSDAEPILKKTLEILEKESKLSNFKNPDIEAYIALVYTRIGRFSEAIRYSERIRKLSTENPLINYKIARMYAMQAGANDTLYYDKKTKKPVLKEFIKSIDFLKKAIQLHYSYEEILDADFYNLRRTPEFFEAIKIKEK